MRKPCLNNKTKWYPLLIYISVWLLAVGVYFMMSPSDAMGYWILFFWVVLPLAAFITAVYIGRERVWHIGHLTGFALFYGVMYMLSRYVTFTIGHKLPAVFYGQITVPPPELSLIVPGIIFFLAGILRGRMGR